MFCLPFACVTQLRVRCCGNDPPYKRAPTHKPPTISFFCGSNKRPFKISVNHSMPATMMLANKENAVLHAPGHGKANPKTPGPAKMAAKTPFKIPLNDENTTLLAKTGKKTAFVGRDLPQFVTPVGEKSQSKTSCCRPNSSDVTRPPKTGSRRKDYQREGSSPGTVNSAGKDWPEQGLRFKASAHPSHPLATTGDRGVHRGGRRCPGD